MLVTDERIARGREMLRSMRPTFDAVEKRLWGRPPHHRGDLGHRDEIRHRRRRAAGDPLDRDARLRRAAAGLFQGRVSRRAGDPASRRYSRRAAERLMGRRVRPDPVHADGIQALRGRFRRRRPARRGRLGARRDRVDREPPEEGRLGYGPDLGLRGRAAAGLQFLQRRPGAQAHHARNGRGSASRARRASRSRVRATRPICSSRRARAGRPS